MHCHSLLSLQSIAKTIQLYSKHATLHCYLQSLCQSLFGQPTCVCQAPILGESWRHFWDCPAVWSGTVPRAVSACAPLAAGGSLLGRTTHTATERRPIDRRRATAATAATTGRRGRHPAGWSSNGPGPPPLSRVLPDRDRCSEMGSLRTGPCTELSHSPRQAGLVVRAS